MKLVIFDCDGTLVDSQHFIVEAMNMAFRANGLDVLPREEVLSGVGLSLPLAIERLIPDQPRATILAVSDGYREASGALRRSSASHEPLYEGVGEVVEMLASRNDTLLGVATGKSIRGVDRLLNHMNWTEQFVTIQTADTNPSKPDPGMIETAMREAGAEPHDTIMIGDTTFDMEMARNAGVAALGVAWGYHPIRSLTAAGADLVAHSAHELIDKVDHLLRGSAN
jgi:phosphoglycolate phosphatase